MSKKQTGFTIVELLIVIVVIAILAAISITSYNSMQARARDTVRQNDIKHVQSLIELYAARHGEYPRSANSITTQSATTVRTDANCNVGSRESNWVPGITEQLPQSQSNNGKSAFNRGCYMYASDGERYIISAWGNIETGPQTKSMYRRIGFRELGYSSSNIYLCNHSAIGGTTGGYNAARDYYKHSFTLTNITTCNETPPAGA